MIGPELNRVWGWPYRGLGSSYTITGHTGSVFKDGQSWLIDLGLPAISLTAEEATEATTNGWAWQNYGHISGGYCYGVNLQSTTTRKDTFVYFAPDGTAWRYRVTVQNKSGNNIDVVVAIKRFGLFGFGEATTATTTTTVACTSLSGVTVLGWGIEDVYKNGEKCLIAVAHHNLGKKRIYSLLELVPSVTHGVPSYSVTEIRGGASETSGTYSLPKITAPTGESWYDSISMPGCMSGQTPPVQSTDAIFIHATQLNISYEAIARSAHYTSEGNAKLLRYLFGAEGIAHTTSTIEVNAWSVGCVNNYEITARESITNATFYRLQADNDVLIDLWTRTYTFGTDFTICISIECQGGGGDCNAGTPSWGVCGTYTTDSAPTSDVYSGFLVDAYYGVGHNIDDIAEDFEKATEIWDYTPRYGNASAGYYHAPSNAHGFYKRTTAGGPYTWSEFYTPAGMKTFTPPSASVIPTTIYFAWNRKTGDTAFSTVPICYV